MTDWRRISIRSQTRRRRTPSSDRQGYGQIPRRGEAERTSRAVDVFPGLILAVFLLEALLDVRVYAGAEQVLSPSCGVQDIRGAWTATKAFIAQLAKDITEPAVQSSPSSSCARAGRRNYAPLLSFTAGKGVLDVKECPSSKSTRIPRGCTRSNSKCRSF